MNQKEIARHLNISQTTVSMAIRGSPKVSARTRDAVQTLAREIDYRPNAAGQLLRKGKSHVIGAVFHSITNSFYSSLFHELQNRLLRNGYLLCLFKANSADELDAVRDNLRRMQMAGVVALSAVAKPLVALKDEGMAFVVFGEDPPMGDGVSEIGPDHYAIGREITQYLLSHGHRRIAFLGRVHEREPRFLGYCSVMAEAGLPVEYEAAEGIADSMDRGCSMMRSLLARRPETEAVFAHNDEVAIGALHGAALSGYDVPGRLSLAGFDNVETGRFLNPPLTTAETSLKDVVEALAAELAASLDDPGHFRKVKVRCRLVVRESVVSASTRMASGERPAARRRAGGP